MFTKEDFTQEFCKELLSLHGTKKDAALALHGKVFGLVNPTQPVSTTTIEKYILFGLSLGLAAREDESRQGYIEELLTNANTPVSAIKGIQSAKISSWGVHCKNPDTGEIETKSLYSTRINLIPEAPAFPTQDRPPSTKIIQYERGPIIMKKTWQCVVISDTQIGFLQDPETKAIEPIHDPRALSVAKQIVADVGPRKLAWIGDIMDWPFLSRWQQHDQYDAVNESINAAYEHLCEFISAAGPQLDQKIAISGNHDLRPEKLLLENNRKALRIRRAADTTGWPVFSQKYLLRYDELGMTTTAPFPRGMHYLLPDLVLVHAPPKVNEFQASVMFGHVTDMTVSYQVQHTSDGRKRYGRYGIGCLCRVDQYADQDSLISLSVPSDRARSNAQQGIAVVNVIDGGKFSVDLIEIENGFALYGGQSYEAS